VIEKKRYMSRWHIASINTINTIPLLLFLSMILSSHVSFTMTKLLLLLMMMMSKKMGR